MLKKYQLLFSFISIFSTITNAQNPVIELQEFSSGYSSPVDVRNCGDSRLFIVQQNGYIYISDSLGIKLTTPFLDIHTKIIFSGERGLLGLAFHPDYLSNGYFFLYYTRAVDGYLRISRFTVDSTNENAGDPNSELILMDIPHPSFQNHNGGCLQFGKDGYLYIGTGDGGSAGDPGENAQNTKNYLGKLLRVDVDLAVPYAIPAGNPFVNDPDNYYPEIWAYGLRNPWRFSFDRFTGDLWIGDVGQNLWEEIDYMPLSSGGGQNYGWDCYEGTHSYEPANCDASSILTYPAYEYQHSSGSNGDCSVTGGYVYRGGQFGNLFGRYIFVDFCSGKFRATTHNPTGTFTTILAGDEVIGEDEFSFSSIGEDYLGEIYVTDITHGKIYRIVDTACVPTASILTGQNNILSPDSYACLGTQLTAASGTGLTYQWQLNSADIAGATSGSHIAAETGIYSLRVVNQAGCENVSEPVEVGLGTIPVIDGIDSIYCILQPADTLIGIPAGGIFSGEGMNGNLFDPTVAGTGIHDILYTYENLYGCIETAIVSLEVELCTNADQIKSVSDHLFLYPVPGNSVIFVTNSHTSEAVAKISIFTLSGMVLKEYGYQAFKNGRFELDMQPIADGMYFLKIETGNNTFFKKLIIKK